MLSDNWSVPCIFQLSLFHAFTHYRTQGKKTITSHRIVTLHSARFLVAEKGMQKLRQPSWVSLKPLVRHGVLHIPWVKDSQMAIPELMMGNDTPTGKQIHGGSR